MVGYEVVDTKCVVRGDKVEKFIVLGNDESQKAEFEYEIGETIRVNSVDTYMCKDKKELDGELYQFFFKGRLVFD